ncbi:MAG: DUF1499 domain-containing protein [Desulfobacterales bacterium]|nr:DUF1499 domain-containing protein [Desulfobacterales bacterium]
MNKQIQIVITAFLLMTGCSGKMPGLGVANGQLVPCPTTLNCVSSQAQGQKNYIEPIRYMGNSFGAKSHLLNILGEFDRFQIIVADEHYIRVEFTSKVFRFVDDVEFYFPDTKSEATIVHVRSASRVGILDFGVNRRRIEKIRREIDTVNSER